MPYSTVTKRHYDSGDYPAKRRTAAEQIDFAAIRARQGAGEPDGRLIGVGFASYTEQTAMAGEWVAARHPDLPGSNRRRRGSRPTAALDDPGRHPVARPGAGDNVGPGRA